MPYVRHRFLAGNLVDHRALALIAVHLSVAARVAALNPPTSPEPGEPHQETSKVIIETMDTDHNT